MITPPVPANEKERLADLASFRILDSNPEQAYDDLLTIIAGICATPMGSVSLIDGDRQWFKARRGLGASETPRDVSFFVAIIDIDHFKTINDLHGHAAGDDALAAIGRAIHSQRGGHGFAARLGGEEFGVLMPDIAPLPAELQCEYIREAVQNLSINVPATVSVGVASYAQGDSATSICARADEALYAAKRGGRNRVVIVDPSSPPTSPTRRSLDRSKA